MASTSNERQPVITQNTTGLSHVMSNTSVQCYRLILKAVRSNLLMTQKHKGTRTCRFNEDWGWVHHFGLHGHVQTSHPLNGWRKLPSSALLHENDAVTNRGLLHKLHTEHMCSLTAYPRSYLARVCSVFWHMCSNIEHICSNIEHMCWNIEHMCSDIEHMCSDIEHMYICVQHVFRYRTHVFRYRTCRTHVFKYRTYVFKYRTHVFRYRMHVFNLSTRVQF